MNLAHNCPKLSWRQENDKKNRGNMMFPVGDDEAGVAEQPVKGSNQAFT